jgi:hypothetical protein
MQKEIDQSFIEVAKDGYKAYGEVVDYKNYAGNPMPAWEELPEKIQEAWIAASKKAFLAGWEASLEFDKQ